MNVRSAKALLAIEETNAALQDLEDLVAGLHAHRVTRHGLAGALRVLADRTAVPVVVEVDLDGRLPREIEACVYFVTSEALQNVSKYASASCARVRAAQRRDHLVLQIEDDGVGGAQLGAGTGLTGAQDRVESIGGSFAITSPTGGGTCIRVELPLHLSGRS